MTAGYVAQPRAVGVGMDYTTAPHLIGGWRYLMNLRPVNGVLEQRPYKTSAFDTGTAATIQAMTFLPVGRLNYGAWLALTPTQLLQLRTSGTTALNATAFNAALTGTRWSTCKYNGRWFFVNEENQVRFTEGGSVHEVFEHWTTATKVAAVGSGPFASSTGAALGSSFPWTAGTEYRVSLANYKRVRVGFTVALTFTVDVGGTATTYTLVGVVTSVNKEEDYSLVKASTTVASVANTHTRWLLTVTDMPVPRGRYVQMFYDHLVIGAPTYNGIDMPNAVMWSHLQDLGQWQSGTDSEADTYTCTEFQSDEDSLGITGMALWKNLNVIYTPGAIYAMQYTGLPRVVHVNPLVVGYGCGLRHSVATLDDSQVFIDTRHRNVYALREGRLVEEFGTPIRDYLFATMSTDFAKQQRTWSFVDKRNREVVWVYVGTGDVFDKAIVFNYETKQWYAADVEQLHSFAPMGKRCYALDELSGLLSALPPTAILDTFGQSSESLSVGWGTVNGIVAREAVAGDADNVLMTMETPTAETGDLLFGSIQQVKELGSVAMSATGSPFYGVNVYAEGRKSLEQSVPMSTLVGYWTTSLAEQVLTFKPVPGKVLRLKFTPKTGASTVRGWSFKALELNVNGAGATR